MIMYASKWSEFKCKYIYAPWYGYIKNTTIQAGRRLRYTWRGIFKGWKYAPGKVPHQRNGWLRAMFFHCPCTHCSPPMLREFVGPGARKFVENYTTLHYSSWGALKYWFWVHMRSLRIRKYD